MKKISSISNLYFALIGCTLLVLSYSFYSSTKSTHEHFFIMLDGNQVYQKVKNPYKYQQNLRNTILSGTLLISGLLLIGMILIPNQEKSSAKILPTPKKTIPQPSQEKESTSFQESEIIKVADEESSKLEKNIYVEQTVNNELENIDDEEEFELSDNAIFSAEGSDDVVFGTGPISNNAIIDFVNRYPDSALKFLFRKTMEGINIDKTDQNIYKIWEQRGMSRKKVKEYILSLMDWESLPRISIHEIWKKLRDKIFDLQH